MVLDLSKARPKAVLLFASWSLYAGMFAALWMFVDHLAASALIFARLLWVKWRYYVLTEQIEAFQYAWYAMTKLARERLRTADGVEPQWKMVLAEQVRFLRQFGIVKPLPTREGRRGYERRLLRRHKEILAGHLAMPPGRGA